MVCEPDAATHPTPQDHQLMSKHRVLSLKPQLRLERRGQDGQNEMKQSGHSASLCDSITLSTQTRFSVQTTVIREKLPNTSALSGTVHSTGRTGPDRCTKAPEDFLPPAFPKPIFSGKSISLSI